MTSHIDTVLSTLAYRKALAGKTLLVKLGGSTIENMEDRQWLFEDLATIRSAGISVVMVHGGGPAINAELRARGIQWDFIDGQRVTTPEIMKVIEMVLCGQINRHIVRGLNLAGIPAVGLSGIESSTLLCKAAARELGQVGIIEHVDTTLLETLMKADIKDGLGAIPVIAPIGIGANGDTFNINADWVASRVAQFLGIKKVIYLTDQDGIWDENKKIIPELDASEVEHLIETGVVQGGMLVKTKTILSSLRNGVEAVHIISGNRPHAILEELFTEKGIGTICRLRSRARVSTEGESL